MSQVEAGESCTGISVKGDGDGSDRKRDVWVTKYREAER